VVARQHDDDAYVHSFEVSRDGLRLLVTLFELEHTVYVSLFRDGFSAPLFTVRRDRCTHVHVTQAANCRRFFEAGAPERPVTNMGIPPVLVRGVRVYMEPQFQVELIEKRYAD